jgi:hypothetical protein
VDPLPDPLLLRKFGIDLFAKMKESLQGTRYNTRGRSLLDINRRGYADGVRLLPQIWQNVVHMGPIILKECKRVYLR